ncbi:hypothetical protein BDZ94DRAFT_1276228 [Collybia nuda]|uniref:Uncharacterized protein n=1 Tax=Collybia nuda TaxID=64659 RepID=A0A9P5XV17_9AGAR|nr:hypothetical protein BDZ94DRAFT_1276228 [Collybia nuda]
MCCLPTISGYIGCYLPFSLTIPGEPLVPIIPAERVCYKLHLACACVCVGFWLCSMTLRIARKIKHQ